MADPVSAAKKSWTSDSPETTRRVAAEFAETAKPGECFGLIGPLGAGKTTFVKGVVEALGGDPASVRSPTYALVQHYPETDPEITHADLYRTEGSDQQETLGLRDYFAETLSLVEWAERWSLGWPDSTRTLLFRHREETSRSIDYLEVSPDEIDDALLEDVFPSEDVMS